MSRARTLSGENVIIGALCDMSMFDEVLTHAEDERRPDSAFASTPLWLYVPDGVSLPQQLPTTVVIKRVRQT